MPKPREGESKKAFISRCIKYMYDHEPERSKEAKAGICYGLWNQAHKKESKSKKK
jgi:hypothetical protein